MSDLDKVVEKAYTNLRVPGECTFPTEDELCWEYCRITGKDRTDSIKTAVSRSARKQRFIMYPLRRSKNLDAVFDAFLMFDRLKNTK
jgi:hypothetical protein